MYAHCICPTGNITASRLSDYRLSASCGGKLRAPLKLYDYLNTIVSRGLSGDLNWASILQRDASLSNSGCNFSHSGVYMYVWYVYIYIIWYIYTMLTRYARLPLCRLLFGYKRCLMFYVVLGLEYNYIMIRTMVIIRARLHKYNVVVGFFSTEQNLMELCIPCI